jgi:hypothetical protein
LSFEWGWWWWMTWRVMNYNWGRRDGWRVKRVWVRKERKIGSRASVELDFAIGMREIDAVFNNQPVARIAVFSSESMISKILPLLSFHPQQHFTPSPHSHLRSYIQRLDYA